MCPRRHTSTRKLRFLTMVVWLDQAEMSLTNICPLGLCEHLLRSLLLFRPQPLLPWILPGSAPAWPSRRPLPALCRILHLVLRKPCLSSSCSVLPCVLRIGGLLGGQELLMPPHTSFLRLPEQDGKPAQPLPAMKGSSSSWKTSRILRLGGF